MRCSLFLTAAALGGLLLVAEEASAQRVRIGIGSGGYGGYGRSYGGYGGYGRYYDGYYGRPGASFNIGPVRVGVGSGGYDGYRSYYSSPGYYSSPRYYSSPGYYSTPSTYYSSPGTYSSSPSVTYSQPSIVQGDAEEAEFVGRRGSQVEVIMPDPQGQIWFDGLKSSSTGQVRYFGFPEDQPGKTNTHKFTATFMRDGEMVTETREVRVEGGKTAVVDFTKPKDSSSKKSEDPSEEAEPPEEDP